MPFMSIDFPAPVSPVNTFSACVNPTVAFSMTARFSMYISSSKEVTAYAFISMMFLSSLTSLSASFSVRMSIKIVSSPARVPTAL